MYHMMVLPQSVRSGWPITALAESNVAEGRRSQKVAGVLVAV